jgi:hypothetical protein
MIKLSQRDNTAKLKALIDDFGGLETVLKAIQWMESKGGFSKILQLVQGKKTASIYVEAGAMDKVRKLVTILLLVSSAFGLSSDASAGELSDKVSEAYSSGTQTEEVQENMSSQEERLYSNYAESEKWFDHLITKYKEAKENGAGNSDTNSKLTVGSRFILSSAGKLANLLNNDDAAPKTIDVKSLQTVLGMIKANMTSDINKYPDFNGTPLENFSLQSFEISK